jgi:SAM-dependent methyltransferase
LLLKNNNDSIVSKTFDNIYENNLWGVGSGTGSYKENATEWIKTVNWFIKKNNILSILDLGCGDGQILDLLNINDISYMGVDVSNVALELNKSKNRPENFTFVNEDILIFDYPNVDLIIIKDVLQHLPYKTIDLILKKIKNSCKYALICEDFQDSAEDVEPGGWRGLNLISKKFDINLQFLFSYTPKNVDQVKKRVYLFNSNND